MDIEDLKIVRYDYVGAIWWFRISIAQDNVPKKWNKIYKWAIDI